MFGMSHDAYLLLDALVTIIGLIVLITRFKVHPFIALIIAAGFLGQRVQQQRAAFQIVEQRVHALMEERQPMLHAGITSAFRDSLIE